MRSLEINRLFCGKSRPWTWGLPEERGRAKPQGTEDRGQGTVEAGKQACPPVVENPGKQERVQGSGGKEDRGQNVQYSTEQYSIIKGTAVSYGSRPLAESGRMDRKGEGGGPRAEVRPLTTNHQPPTTDQPLSGRRGAEKRPRGGGAGGREEGYSSGGGGMSSGMMSPGRGSSGGGGGGLMPRGPRSGRPSPLARPPLA